MFYWLKEGVSKFWFSALRAEIKQIISNQALLNSVIYNKNNYLLDLE